MEWLNVLGLAFDLAGAVVIAVGVVASGDQIKRVTSTAYGGANLATIADRRKQSRYAIAGLGLLCLGFVLQLIGSWPR
jgi:hypothetical protein